MLLYVQVAVLLYIQSMELNFMIVSLYFFVFMVVCSTLNLSFFTGLCKSKYFVPFHGV